MTEEEIKRLNAEVGDGLATGGLIETGEGAELTTGGYLEYSPEVEPEVPVTPEVPAGGVLEKIPLKAGTLRAWNGVSWAPITPRVFLNGGWHTSRAMMWNGIEWCTV